MISYLKGKLIFKALDSVIIDVQGVGYKVFVSEKNLSHFPLSQEVEVFCHLHVKEDALELYGFLSPEELHLFNILNNVSGIGPKAALGLSSLGTMQELKKAIETRNISFFAGLKGIGRKKIQKIMLELTGKIESIASPKDISGDEATQALMSLGFTLSQAREALSQVPGNITSPKERIQSALKALGKRN